MKFLLKSKSILFEKIDDVVFFRSSLTSRLKYGTMISVGAPHERYHDSEGF